MNLSCTFVVQVDSSMVTYLAVDMRLLMVHQVQDDQLDWMAFALQETSFVNLNEMNFSSSYTITGDHVPFRAPSICGGITGPP